MLRRRTVVAVDLKDERARAGLADLVRRADVLIEGFRPGVAERLGLGLASATRSTRALSTRG